MFSKGHQDMLHLVISHTYTNYNTDASEMNWNSNGRNKFPTNLAFWACTSWQSNLNFIEGHTWEIIYLTSAGTAKVNSSDCNTSNTEVGLNQNLNTQISYQALLQIQMSTLQKRLRFPVTQPNNQSLTAKLSHWLNWAFTLRDNSNALSLQFGI